MKAGVSTLHNHMMHVDTKNVNQIMINGYFLSYVFLLQRLLILNQDHDTQLRYGVFLLRRKGKSWK